MTRPPVDADCVLSDLREIAELTSDAAGAQRVAWGPVWREARGWLAERVAGLGLEVEQDLAGNGWVRLAGRSERSLLLGGHLDSVPNGGWLDGTLGIAVSLEALRRYAGSEPPVTLWLVDWADEEGARFGRSLLGSSAASGSLDPAEVGRLRDGDGIPLAEALRENGVDPKRMGEAHAELLARRPAAYLELHIEQGPTLEEMGLPAAAVVGTFGVERHRLRFEGQAAHSGSTPLPVRRDAFLAAAEWALACRESGLRHSGDEPETRVVSTCGSVRVQPDIPTAVPGLAEITLDQRALQADTLADLLADARVDAARLAEQWKVEVGWAKLWSIEPRAFDPDLVRLCEEAVREVSGKAPRLPSGALHDAAEMVPHMPTAMMFAASRAGLSHCREEDTSEADLRSTVEAFQRWVDKTVGWLAAAER